MAARPHNQRQPANGAGTGTGAGAISMPPVRRNLFKSHLSRRPNRPDSTMSSATTLVEEPLDRNDDGAESSDILVRNANGDYATNIPSLSFMMADANGAAGSMDHPEEIDTDEHLSELLRSRTRRESDDQELLEAVRISLKRKVEALADDDWMFEKGR